MEENKNPEIENKMSNSSGWLQYDKFLEFHDLQLFGMGFPKDLGEKLYYKLKYEVFDCQNYFNIFDNQEQSRFQVKAKKTMKKHSEVFLIDHAWTFKVRQFNEFCEKYPEAISRVCNMLKYAYNKREIQVKSGLDFEVPVKKDLESYIEEIKQKGCFKSLNYDNMDLEDLNKIYVDESTEAISLEDNKIGDVSVFFELLGKYKNIKAIWIRNNPCLEGFENEIVSQLVSNFENLEIVNRKFTPNYGKWALDFIKSNFDELESQYKEYNKLYNRSNVLDLSGRDPLTLSNYEVFEHVQDTKLLDLRDNEDNLNDNFEKVKEFLSVLPNVERILIDLDLTVIFDESETENFQNSLFCKFIQLYDSIESQNPSLKFLNNYDYKTLSKSFKEGNLVQTLKNYFIKENIWQIAQTYRLTTSEKFDEHATWYVNDEFGSAIAHSDKPNVAAFPFVFSLSGTFKEDSITYTILWPIEDIITSEEITRDYLYNIGENKQRSSRLTVWFNTPKEYFLKKFEEKLRRLEKVKENNEAMKYREIIENINKTTDTEEANSILETLWKFYAFDNISEGIDHDLIKETTRNNILVSITGYDESNKIKIDEYLVSLDRKIKLFTDLDYVRNSIHLENIEITNNLEDADIFWLNTLFVNIKGTPNLNLKPIIFSNQFPFESIITMKSLLMHLIQENLGLTTFFNISYDMESELAQIIGNFFYNEDNNIDNSWILKPINMARSMDMVVTNSLSEIIRCVETGPKICQKYLERPLLLNGRKFDLRFIVLLKSLIPLEAYMYNRVFWVRSANNEFTMDELSFVNYETHFTVMNYTGGEMKQIFDKDFLEYLDKINVNWTDIYRKIKEMLRDLFIITSKGCPQMINPYSRALYGLDVMIDENLNPKILEMNYSPDCTRATKYTPEFYDDIISTLYLNKPSGVEEI